MNYTIDVKIEFTAMDDKEAMAIAFRKISTLSHTFYDNDNDNDILLSDALPGSGAISDGLGKIEYTITKNPGKVVKLHE